MSEPEPPPAPPAVEDLQFQHAEFSPNAPRLPCAFCKREAGESDYRAGGAVACSACARRLSDLQIKPDTKTLWTRAFPWGVGAAIAGAIIFAIISLTGFQFALVAILVGYMVGKAIVRATQGRTSRACQVMAVVLTYGAITTSYMPFFIAGAVKQMSKRAKNKPAPPPDLSSAEKMSLGTALIGLVVGIALLIGVALVMPFLIVVHAPVSGLINLLIIFIGLRKAWTLTTPFRAEITGPYLAAQPQPTEAA